MRKELDNITDSRKMYITEILKYPLLTDEEEVQYGLMLENPGDKKLLSFKSDDHCNMPTLNIELLLCSLCNNPLYQSIIEDLIAFHNQLDNDNTKVISVLKKYLVETKKVNRSLNSSELKSAFNITYDDINALSAKDLLNEIKSYMNYVYAFNKMFHSNLRLVVSIVSNQFRYNIIDFMELVSEGNLGLMKAVYGYKISKGNRFSTYATKCIEQTLIRYVAGNGQSIKLTENRGREIYKFRGKLSELERKNERQLTIDEIAKELGISTDTIVENMTYMNGDVYLDARVREDSDLTLKDVIPSPDDSITEMADQEDTMDTIEELFSVLDERAQDIIKMRFGLGEYGGKPVRVEEIGKKYSISKQRAAQIVMASILKMKRKGKAYLKQKSLFDNGRYY